MLNQLIARRKREYYRSKVKEAKSNINKLYRVLDGLTGYKRSNVLPDGYSDLELANMFVEYYQEKTENIITSFNAALQGPALDMPVPMPTMKLSKFHRVDKEIMKAIVQKVKPTHCENDPLPISDISGCTNFGNYLDILTDIVNTSIENNIFPESEKAAIVRPIIKGKLDPQCLSSYRPVSNLTYLSKILENVVLKQLLDHLELMQAIPDQQSAYRKLYSTETTLCSVVNNLLVLMDEGKCGVLILLDLSAAFDTVEHNLLLQVCEDIGIEGSALKYLKSYLENRTFCVHIGKSSSVNAPLQRGVPQGSVLGPILFCIYTKDLAHLLSRHGVDFKLYADDTQFSLSLSYIDNTLE